MSTTTGAVTPAEADLPKIISVDDHILEPRDLWQQRAPGVAARPRAPGRRGRRSGSSSRGGHYGFTRDDPDGQWCDLWLFDDLVLPTGLLHAAAGVPPEEQRERPGDLRGLPPGHLRPDGARSPTWTRTTSRRRSTTRTRSRASPARASPSAPTRTSRSLCLQIYNDWMIDEWCGGAGRGRLIPLTLVPLWDPQLAAAGGAALRGEGQLRDRLHREPVQARLPVALHGRVGRPLWDACVETDTTVSMHIGSSSIDADHVARRAARHVDVAERAERRGLAVRLGVLAARSSASPTLKIAYAESQVGWMPFLLERMDTVWRDGRRRRRARPSAPSEVRARAGCAAASSTTCTASTAATRSALEHDPVRDRLPAHRRHVARTRARSPTGCARPRAWTPRSADAFLRGNAIRAYGLERFGITA